MTRKPLFVTALLGALALAGCGSTPKTNFYTLSPAAAPAPTGARVSYSVAIGAIALPDGIDRPQLVVRTGANQVSVAEFERWVGAPKDEIARALAANLTKFLDGASVYAYPQSANISAECNVLVDVQRFDSALGDAATIEVLWQVRPARGAPKSGRSVVREPAGGAGYDALVAAHGRALVAVSRDIAAAVRAAMSP
ncbi:MAG: PqiC family protein [Burkholderiales bacterium]